MEVVRDPNMQMQQTVHAITARTVTQFLHIIEVSHISISKTSITLRVNHVGGIKSAIRTRAKIQLF